MERRWPLDKNFITREYVDEWALRFKQNREFAASDGTGKSLLRELTKELDVPVFDEEGIELPRKKGDTMKLNRLHFTVKAGSKIVCGEVINGEVRERVYVLKEDAVVWPESEYEAQPAPEEYRMEDYKPSPEVEKARETIDKILHPRKSWRDRK